MNAFKSTYTKLINLCEHRPTGANATTSLDPTIDVSGVEE